MNRRQFVGTLSGSTLAAPVVLTASRAEAFVPVLAAIAGFVARQAARQVVKNVIRSISRRPVSRSLRSQSDRAVKAMARTENNEPAFSRIASDLGGEIAGEIASNVVKESLAQTGSSTPREAVVAIAETPDSSALCMAITTDIPSPNNTTFWTSPELVAVGRTSEKMVALGIPEDTIAQVLLPLETYESGWLTYDNGYVDYDPIDFSRPSVQRTPGGLLYLSNTVTGSDFTISLRFIPGSGYTAVTEFERTYTV